MRTALVTGANRGIGKAFTEELASKGFVVYAGMRDIASNPFTNELVRPLSLDVRDDTSIHQAMQTIEDEQGSLHLLVNNAGINGATAGDGRPELAGELARVERGALLAMFDINAVSPLIMAKYAAPLMRDEGCFIINISSDRASYHDPNPHANGNYGYRASKAALNMVTYSLIEDLPDNISTFAVHPGSVKTDMNPRYGTMQPVDAARAVLGVLDNWQPGLNGRFLNNDGSLYPL